MIRLASVLIALGLVPLAQSLFDLNGDTATRATFLGTPSVVLGVALALLARFRTRSSD
ncbi:MAG TPA: hypothetical protein VMR86_17305 [Myxococcota bacterium]|nr:hypothetical protein [Myxococcota bacterium]